MSGVDVALVLAGQRFEDSTGSQGLDEVRRHRPHAKWAIAGVATAVLNG